MVDEHVHFLQKPFSPKALAEKVREVLESRTS
jgi:FixJ family two-component response regulator